jgi:hypothetical protein
MTCFGAGLDIAQFFCSFICTPAVGAPTTQLEPWTGTVQVKRLLADRTKVYYRRIRDEIDILLTDGTMSFLLVNHDPKAKKLWVLFL